MSIQELNVYALWAGKQTGKGVPNNAPSKRLIQTGGDFNAPRVDAKQEFSDLQKYGGAHDWVNTLVGNGAPVVEATPEELAYLLWLHHGGETATPVVGPPAKTRHEFAALPGLGHWATFFKRLGVSQITRHQYNDCMVGQVVMEGATGQKNVRITPTVVSLDPAQNKAADPAPALPSKEVLLYTDGTASFTIDGTVFRGASAFTLTLNDDLQPVYSDDVTVFDLGIGNPAATISVTFYLDDDGMAQFNKQLFGVAAPAADARPLHRIPGFGSYAFDLAAKDDTGAPNGDVFDLDAPNIKWALPDTPGPNPAGGTAEVTMTGELRPPAGGGSPYTIGVENDDAAYTV